MTDAGYSVGIRHIANSCAALRFPETRLDAVRIGSALIGALPAAVPVKLQSVSVCKARVVDRKFLSRGDTTGYASVCKVKRDTEAIVVAMGYDTGFGYLKSPANLGPLNLALYLYRTVKACLHPPCVMYGNRRLPLVGRVGSQYSLFDATGVEIAPGEYVTAKANLLFPGQRRKFI